MGAYLGHYGSLKPFMGGGGGGGGESGLRDIPGLPPPF